jgi:hypothetical protein
MASRIKAGDIRVLLGSDERGSGFPARRISECQAGKPDVRR